MQRRAATVYVAFFLVVAVAAFGFAATAEAPSVSVDAEFELQDGQEFELDGVTYTVEAVDDEGDGPGTAELSWVNQEGTITETWSVGENVTYEGQEYTVEVPDAEEPTFELVRGEDRQSFSEGETLTYQGNETTVEVVTPDEVTVSWTGPVTEEIPITEGVPVDIGDTEYVAHFPGDGRFQLTSDVADYQSQVDDAETTTDRINATWVVGILSALAALLLVAMAFLPRKEQ